jgi:hypothetical protein
MATFNITVDIDWISEDGSIDKEIQDAIINQITSKFSAKVEGEIVKAAEQQISSKVSNVIDQKVSEITENLLAKKFDLVDRWGDVEQKDVTVKGMLKKRLDSFLEEKVDKNGNPSRSGYGETTTRLDYVIRKNIDYEMENKIKSAASEIKKKLEEYITTTLKAQIGENVAQIIGLGKITSRLTSN